MSDDKYSGELHAWIEPELEARLVALVLGEASDFEKDELTRLMEERPELAVFKERLERMDEVLRESVKPTDDEKWKLSPATREKVLEAIGQPSPEPVAVLQPDSPKSKGYSWRRSLLGLAACLVMLIVVASLTTPAVFKSLGRSDSAVLAAQKRAEEAQTYMENVSYREGVDIAGGGPALESPAAPASSLSAVLPEGEALAEVELGRAVVPAPASPAPSAYAAFDAMKQNVQAGNRVAMNEAEAGEADPFAADVSSLRRLSGGDDPFASDDASLAKLGEKVTPLGTTESLRRTASQEQRRFQNVTDFDLAEVREIVVEEEAEPFGLSRGMESSARHRSGAREKTEPNAEMEMAYRIIPGQGLEEAQVHPRFSEVRQANSEELRFDWMARSEAVKNQAARGRGSDKDFGDGWGVPTDVQAGSVGRASLGFGVNGAFAGKGAETAGTERTAGDFISPAPQAPPSDALANVVTGGIRSGDAAISRNSIDALLNEPAGGAGAHDGADAALFWDTMDASGSNFSVPPASGKPKDLPALAGRTSFSSAQAPAAKPESLAVQDQEFLWTGADQTTQFGRPESVSGPASVPKLDDLPDAGLALYKRGSESKGRPKVEDALSAESAREFDRTHAWYSKESDGEPVARNERSLAMLSEGGESDEEASDDPIRTNPSLNYENIRNVDQVRKDLYMGEGFYNLGQFDKANEHFNEVLRTDPYNKEARRWQERVNAAQSDYYRAAYDETRSRLLAEVDKAWEQEVPAEPGQEGAGAVTAPAQDGNGDDLGSLGAILETQLELVESRLAKMQQVVGDRGDQAVDKALSGGRHELDSKDLVEEKRQVSDELVRKVGIPYVEGSPTASIGESENSIYLTAERNLYDHEREKQQLEIQLKTLARLEGEERYKYAAGLNIPNNGAPDLYEQYQAEQREVEALSSKGLGENHPEVKMRAIRVKQLRDELDRAVGLGGDRFERRGGEGEDLVDRTFSVSPEVMEQLRLGMTPADSDDPFGAEVAVELRDAPMRELLQNQGISFPGDAAVRYVPERGVLVLRNTPGNLDLTGALVEKLSQQVKSKKRAEKERELSAKDEPFSTFSLHVSDVSFKLAQAALAKGQWPEAERIRSEEFVNALDYGDAMPTQRQKVSCQLEQAVHPFAQQRNLLRVSMRTAATGREAATPLRLTILLDNSGSMERADRTKSVTRAFDLLAAQLQPQDEVTLISFARTPRLVRDRLSGEKAKTLSQLVTQIPSEGGTNLEAALALGMEKAKAGFLEGAQNRVILLTDGAANLGNARPDELSGMVETMREQGIAFDACGVGAEGLNDEILESLTRKGDGRYYFLDRPEDADEGFAKQIAGALRPAAKNVKVQVEFNPDRVGRYKLYGFEKHELKKEDFRNDSVDAAELAAEEAGVAIYQVETLPEGSGPVGTVSVRFQDTATGQMIERLWDIPYEAQPARLDEADARIRLAATAALLGERLKGTAVGESVGLAQLAAFAHDLPSLYPNQKRVRHLVEMVERARGLAGE